MFAPLAYSVELPVWLAWLALAAGLVLLLVMLKGEKLMAWIRFNRNFSWKPTSQTTVDYSAGSSYNVKAEVAEKAIAKGAAVKMEKKSKAAKPTEAANDGATAERG